MNILVTGGAGFIGSNLIHYLIESDSAQIGFEVETLVNLDKLTYAGNLENLASLKGADPRYVFVHGCIGDGALVAELLHDYRIDVVMHLAAESHVDRSIENPDDFIQTNVVGTYTLLEQFRSYLRDRPPRMGTVERVAFLHVSTDEVFGALGPDDEPFTEKTAYAPNSPYSASKAASDHLARAYYHTYGLPVVTTNCSNNYGPYQFPEKLIPLMIRKAMKGEPLPVYGDGSQVRDWLFVGDHCRGLVAAAARGTPGETYVMGGDSELSNLEVVKNIIDLVQKLAPEAPRKSKDELISFVEDRPGHDWRYAIDYAKIERELGWAPEEDFTSGLEQTVRWYLENEVWVEAIEAGRYRGERLGAGL